MTPLVVLIAVGLTPRHLRDERFAAATKTLRGLAQRGGETPLEGVVPAVTLAAQASLFTGKLPQEHGIVGNGWHYRETDEVRFWQQSRHLIHGELVYERARQRAEARGRAFSVAKLFAWFNQASRVEYAMTPKPHYGADGRKVFGVHGKPAKWVAEMETKLGEFPFFTFWGPNSGSAATEWIARLVSATLREQRPTLTFSYLPVLDYDLQRYGPEGEHVTQALTSLDGCVATVAEAATEIGARLVVLSEYGISAAKRRVTLNRELRRAGHLWVRDGPFGEVLDVPDSPVVAVADHQICHVSLHPYHRERLSDVRELVKNTPGVASVYVGEERAEIGLDHPRAGEIVALAEPEAWFGYEYWLDRKRRPDFAATVDIHRKPGYDPQEMFFAPEVPWPKAALAIKLMRKKLGYRTLMDLIAVDHPELIRGSHGIVAVDPADGPVLLTDAPEMAESLPPRLVDVADWLLAALDLAEDA